MSEEIAAAAAAADLATVEQLRARLRQAESDNARLFEVARAAIECARGLCYDDGTDAAVKKANRWMHWFEKQLRETHPGAQLLVELEQHESQLGAAHAEIARLEEALRDAARMKTIKGARRIVADALEGEVALTKARSE